MWLLICICKLNNLSPIPCSIKCKQSRKGKQKNTRNTLIKLDRNLNLGHLIKNSKKWQIENSETWKSAESSFFFFLFFFKFSSSKFSILSIRSKSKSRKRKSRKQNFEVSEFLTWPWIMNQKILNMKVCCCLWNTEKFQTSLLEVASVHFNKKYRSWSWRPYIITTLLMFSL